MDINAQVLERATRNVSRLLTTYSGEIAEAFLKADDALAVGLSLEFKPKGSGIKITTKINFVADRVKDSNEEDVYPPDPIQVAIDRAEAEQRRQDALCRAGNTEGEWRRLRSYCHR